MGKNSKTLTRRDIAAAVGVSPSTVSRALAGRRDLLPEETIRRIQEAASRMSYHPNALASRLASNRSRQIGFGVPLQGTGRGPFHVSYYSSILDAAVSRAATLGYMVSILPSPTAEGMVEAVERAAGSRLLDGVILAGLHAEGRILADLSALRIPCVAVGVAPRRSGVPCVNVAPGKALADLVSSLESLRYQRLLLVQGNLDYDDARVQKAALSEALASSSVALLGVVEGDYSRRCGARLADEILAATRPGDAVFFANDRMASGFYLRCYERGVQIPERIGVVGSDDDDSSRILYPPLSTIHLPWEEMGAAAASLLIERIEGSTRVPSEMTYDAVFLRRESL